MRPSAQVHITARAERGATKTAVKACVALSGRLDHQTGPDLLREAIRAQQVSRQWVGEFPRHIWHKEVDVWYEACTSYGTAGTYHAYQIEIAGLPAGLKP
jgi:hypothetical protein